MATLLLCTTIIFFSVAASSAPLANAANVPSTYGITWNRAYTESNLMSADTVLQTDDGGFLLAGIISPIEGSAIELIKVDSSGNIQWNQTYNATGHPMGKWLIKTNDGDFAIAGQYAGGFWLAKIDLNGNLLWEQTYAELGFSWASAIVQTSDGGYAIVGQTNSTLGGTHSSSIGATGVVCLLKTDASGIEEWNQTLGDGVVNSVIQTIDGGYAVVGGINNLPDYLLIKTDSTGSLQWTKTYGSKDEDFAFSVVQTSDEGYALGGWMWLRSNGGGPNYAIVKTDASGNPQWTKYYGGGLGWSMIQTSDGGFAISGTSVVKVDAAVYEQWNASFGDDINTNHQAYCIIQTQDGNYAVSGTVSSHAWLAKIGPTVTIQSGSATPSQAPVASAPELSPLMIFALLAAATATLVIVSKTRKSHRSSREIT